MTEQQETTTTEQLKARIKAEQDAAVQECLAEINAVLTRHGCTLVGIPTFVPQPQPGAVMWVMKTDVAVQHAG